MKTARIQDENNLLLVDPVEVIFGEIKSHTPVTPRVVANGNVCYSKIVGWERSVRPNGTYIYKFSAVLNIFQLADDKTIDIQVWDGDELIYETLLPLSEEWCTRLHEFECYRTQSRAWVIDQLRCPDCGSERNFLIKKDTITCRSCSAKFPQVTDALNMMRTDCIGEYSHDFPKQASWHEFSGGILKKIEEITKAGGKVLDLGGGLKTKYIPNVISLELIDYPFVDLIASGDRIPIADEAFDLVLCMSVLEHVKDPFACAKEMARVTKKGGRIHCVVPFMFALHAHPHHYYNMTSMGVANLFDDDVRHDQVRFGHPIKSLHQIASIYYKSLPRQGDARKHFAELTILDLISNTFNGTEDIDFIRELSDAGIEKLAHGTKNWFTKR